MPKDPQFEHISEIGRVKDLRNSKNGSDPYCPLITKHNRYREVAELVTHLGDNQVRDSSLLSTKVKLVQVRVLLSRPNEVTAVRATVA